MTSRWLVIGIGNDYRNDDGAGIAVARRLTARSLRAIDIREMSGEGAALMEVWKNRRRVILIDAVRSGRAPAGTIHRMDAGRGTIPVDFFHYGTHRFGVAEAVELDRQIGGLPEELEIIGIEGGDFGFGTTLTRAVEAAVNVVAKEIAAQVPEVENVQNMT